MSTGTLDLPQHLQTQKGLACYAVADRRELAAIAELREEVYIRCMPHMLGQVTDLHDARAVHFVARLDGRVVGAMRLLPPPFEAARYFPEWETNIRSGARLMELGRFVVAPEEQGNGIGALLVDRMIEWVLANPEVDGVLAYSRESMAKHFFRMGMRVIAKSERLEGKAGEPYYLMAAYKGDQRLFYKWKLQRLLLKPWLKRRK